MEIIIGIFGLWNLLKTHQRIWEVIDPGTYFVFERDGLSELIFNDIVVRIDDFDLRFWLTITESGEVTIRNLVREPDGPWIPEKKTLRVEGSLLDSIHEEILDCMHISGR